MTKRSQYIYLNPQTQDGLGTSYVYDEFEDEWLEKARKLQARRWHHIRSEIKGINHRHSHI